MPGADGVHLFRHGKQWSFAGEGLAGALPQTDTAAPRKASGGIPVADTSDASERSSKSTGNNLNVDAGHVTAFPR